MDNQILLHADHQNSEKSLIIYKSKDDEVQLDVKVMNETVWLTQAQMALLFGTQRQAITKHLKTIFDCHELERTSNSSILELLQKEGNRYVKRNVELFNLDVIISVGYRVNTKRGIEFRQWANQIFDAYSFISDLIRIAKKEIILIDNYIDDSVLKILNKREDNVSTTIYTAHISENLKLDLERHNFQYQPISIMIFKNSHDRFLIIDNDVYHIGASLKDLGKKMFAFSKLNFEKAKILKFTIK